MKTQTVLKICIYAWVMTLISCTGKSPYPASVQAALYKSGTNKKDLLKVIRHYSQSPEDSLKLRAAYFLIANMPGHAFRRHPDLFEPAFDTTAKYRSWKNRTRSFTRELKAVRQEYPVKFYADSLIEDLHHVTADFLIENIDMAFMAYHKISSVYPYDFQTFCRYVLPYRNRNEPLEIGNHKRKREFEKYKWALKQLHSGYPLPRVARSIIDSADLRVNPDVSILGALSDRQVAKARFGLCSDLVDYMVNVFRALGIPASHEFTPHWGNDYRNGHDWMTIPGPDSLLALDAGNGHLLNSDYQKSSMGKAYRVTYEKHTAFYPFTKDVTSEYKTANHITIARKWGRADANQPIYLSVFDRKHSWIPIGRADRVTADSILFRDIGSHVVYLAGYYNQDRRYKSLNNPFIVNENNHVTYLDSHTGRVADSVLLMRKFPPFYMRNRKTKMRRIKLVNTLKFQGSFDSTFSSSRNLQFIHGIRSTHEQTVKLSYRGRYPYYRLKGPDTLRVELAKLQISSPRPYRMVAPFPRRWFHHKFSNLTDGNPLTHWGSKKFMVNFLFDSPAKVTSVTLQARNDDNDINIGDTYELFYWDKGWQSLGRKKAEDTLLVYHKIPEDALYWLRDWSRGREEHVFTITKTGKQWWPGSSNYQ